MSTSRAFLTWLDDKSDWLSPLVVKEVRQIVRAREFNYSFNACLVAGMIVAFFGAADALTGSGTSGWWTFVALMGCLAFLGFGVVPLAAFSALRNERMEQTLELITLTSLSARRIVTGKLLAQGVKLVTLFAVMAPFIAMSFLLGGIDFVTIVILLLLLFMWSLWACAAALFLSTLFTSRAVSGLAFGGAAILLLVVFVVGRGLFFMRFAGPPVFAGGTGWQFWWVLAIATTFCLASMVNLVLLAENRLSLPTEDRVSMLRVGFFLQFLLIAGWTLTFINAPAGARSTAIAALGAVGGLHLAIVAMFTVTEDLVLPRRVLMRLRSSSPWRWLLAMFGPGGGRGALYVLAQMALMLSAAWLLQPTWMEIRWLLAICAYICFFTGVPVFLFRLLRPAQASSLKLRVAVLIMLPIAMLLPDILYYLLWRPGVLDLGYSARHLLNPLRTLTNWSLVEARHWFPVPLAAGVAGLLAYLALFITGMRMTAQPTLIDPHGSAAAAGEPGRANILY